MDFHCFDSTVESICNNQCVKYVAISLNISLEKTIVMKNEEIMEYAWLRLKAGESKMFYND